MSQVIQRPECSYEWCHNLEMPQMYRYTSMRLCMRHYRVARNLALWKKSDLYDMLELQKQGNRDNDSRIENAMLDVGEDTGHKCTRDKYGEGACGQEIFKLHDGRFMCSDCKTTYHIRKPEPPEPDFHCRYCNAGLLRLGGEKLVCNKCRSRFAIIIETTNKIQTYVLTTLERGY